jgi:hypothetical protein
LRQCPNQRRSEGEKSPRSSSLHLETAPSQIQKVQSFKGSSFKTPQISNMMDRTETSSIPEDFLCPITHDIMRSPLMCKSGLSFDRAAILTWLQDHGNTCPLTRESLSPSGLVPNRALEARISTWCEENGMELQDADENDDSCAPVLLTCSVSELERRARKAKKKSKKSSRSTTRTSRTALSAVKPAASRFNIIRLL